MEPTTHASVIVSPPKSWIGCGFAHVCRTPSASLQHAVSAMHWMQGMELGLQTLAAGGALMVGTLQGGKREVSRFEAERDEAGNMTDQPAFDAYLRGVRKTGAPHYNAREAVFDSMAW